MSTAGASEPSAAGRRHGRWDKGTKVARIRQRLREYDSELHLCWGAWVPKLRADFRPKMGEMGDLYDARTFDLNWKWLLLEWVERRFRRILPKAGGICELRCGLCWWRQVCWWH